MTVAIVYTTLGQRRIPIRQNRRAGAASSNARAQYLPLKVNMSGVIPIIFAQAMIMFPGLFASIPSLRVSLVVTSLQVEFSTTSFYWFDRFLCFLLYSNDLQS